MTPLQSNRAGGLRKLSGDEYVAQLILNKVGSDDSDNPFQEESLGASAIFQNASDIGWQAVQRRNITNIFNALETANIARLISVRMGPSEAEEGLFVASITYLSIESSTIQEVQLPLSRTN